MRGTARKVVIGVVSCIVLLGGIVVGVETFAGANEYVLTQCASVTGTAKTKAAVSLSAVTPQPVGVVVTLAATGCNAPNVDAIASNGPATRAKITGTLNSQSALCTLSESDELPWGALTIKWQNASGVTILSAGRAVTDKVYVRPDPEGVERYDLSGFATAGPSGGGDVSGEVGLNRTTACSAGQTKWNVLSDGSVNGGGEPVGGDGTADDFSIEVPLVVPLSSTTTSTTTTVILETTTTGFAPTSWLPSTTAPNTTTTRSPTTTLAPTTTIP